MTVAFAGSPRSTLLMNQCFFSRVALSSVHVSGHPLPVAG